MTDRLPALLTLAAIAVSTLLLPAQCAGSCRPARHRQFRHPARRPALIARRAAAQRTSPLRAGGNPRLAAALHHHNRRHDARHGRRHSLCAGPPARRPASRHRLGPWHHRPDPALHALPLPDPTAGIPALAGAIGRGWAIVATDYAYAEQDGPHPYLIGPAQAARCSTRSAPRAP